jgi:hypothetical protein
MKHKPESNLHIDHCSTRFPLFFKIGNRFRNRRMCYFFEKFHVCGDETILDVGGEPYFWLPFPHLRHVTILSIHPTAANESIRSLTYSGNDFPFGAGEFDIVFSNSVIEHVAKRESFAAEIARCGRGYFVQTPSFWFPFEPHAHIPLFQFMPAFFKRLLHRMHSRSLYPLPELLSLKLLTKGEMKRLFPGARIVTERWLLWPKGYYAIRVPLKNKNPLRQGAAPAS